MKQLFERYKVRVVGFDIAFPEPDTSSGLPIFEMLAERELKDNAQYQAFLKDARASLDYDRDLRRRDRQVARRPRRRRCAARTTWRGCCRRPSSTTKALGGVFYRHYDATGYSGNIAILQKAATATGHIYPALDIDGTHAARADVHALQGGLLRGPVARGDAHLPRQRARCGW